MENRSQGKGVSPAARRPGEAPGGGAKPASEATRQSATTNGGQSAAERYPPGESVRKQPAAPSGSSAAPATPTSREKPAEKKGVAAEPKQTKPKPATAPPSSSSASDPNRPAEKTSPPAEKQKPVGSAAEPGKPADASSKIDSLLPPGSTSQPIPANRPLPVTSQQMDQPVPAGPAVVTPSAAGIPTEDGGFIKLHEPVKKIEHGGEEIELHRLTPEERARKRMFKNMIMAIIGVIFLVGLGALLMYFR
jgi:hypothetical protein